MSSPTSTLWASPSADGLWPLAQAISGYAHPSAASQTGLRCWCDFDCTAVGWAPMAHTYGQLVAGDIGYQFSFSKRDRQGGSNVWQVFGVVAAVAHGGPKDAKVSQVSVVVADGQFVTFMMPSDALMVEGSMPT